MTVPMLEHCQNRCIALDSPSLPPPSPSSASSQRKLIHLLSFAERVSLPAAPLSLRKELISSQPGLFQAPERMQRRDKKEGRSISSSGQRGWGWGRQGPCTHRTHQAKARQQNTEGVRRTIPHLCSAIPEIWFILFMCCLWTVRTLRARHQLFPARAPALRLAAR